MGFTIARKPELDLHGQRWVEFAPGAKILVASIANPIYKSHQSLIKRHLVSIDQQSKVGTAAFSVADIPQEEIEIDDDLYIDLVSRHLISNWEGVDVADQPGIPAPYSPELCKQLIQQMPSVYFLAVQTGLDIATRAEERVQATVKKSSTPTSGGATGRAKRTKKPAGNVKG